MNNTNPYNPQNGIAIIGIAGRFPDAKNVTEFWQNLRQGVNSVRPIPDEELELSDADREISQNDPKYVKMAAPIEDADKFDAAFFGIFPKKAITMDPHQRLFLECCWHALEDGGYVPERYAGSIGVFAGCYMNTYLLDSLRTNPSFIHELADVFHGGSFQNEIGFEKDYLATQVSYLLNLQGPSLTIQTACSTSLVAITSACQSLVFRECDMALAGAATLRFPQKRGYLYEDGGMLSPDGSCKTFDERANGTIFGNGVATILLKRYEDAVADGDDIYAVIRGWGINNDGGRKPGYTAPSVEGQIDAVAKAHKMAGIDGDTITYIEAHGTGTSLGDPIEIDALSQVFRRSTDKKQYCAIGSVKTNVGHLDCVAGIAGLIKTSLALKHAEIPASLNFERPNPRIDFANSPFFVNTELSEWQTNGTPHGTPRRAGISSFGVGGTNAHVILEEATSVQEQQTDLDQQVDAEKQNTSDKASVNAPSAYQLLTLSARSENALHQAATDMAHYLKDNDTVNLADVAHTLNNGRRRFSHTSFIAASNTTDAVEKLEGSLPVVHTRGSQDSAPVTFMFPGQGSQYANMGRSLYETEPVYRDAFNHCSEILRPHLGIDLNALLFIDGEPTPEQQQKITETAFAQPSICAVEYSLAQLWISRGVQPTALLGHSVGEFSAACLAGILSVEDAMSLVALRGQMMQSLPAGKMVAVRLPENELLPYLSDDVAIGAVNSPHLSVISGPSDSVSAVQTKLEEADVVCRPLRTSHAFHSMMMDPILPTFNETVAKMTLHAPQVPVISTVTGKLLSDEEAQSPAYWTSNLRAAVRFADALSNLLTEAKPILLEVGPGQALTMLARQHPGRDQEQQVFSSCSHPKQDTSDAATFCETTGRLWQAGAPLDLSILSKHEERKRLHLPGYPFERKRFWYDTPMDTPQQRSNALSNRENAQIGVAAVNGTNHTPSQSAATVSAKHSSAQQSSTKQSSTKQSRSNAAAGYVDDTQIDDTQFDSKMQRLIDKQLSIMKHQLQTYKKK